MKREFIEPNFVTHLLNNILKINNNIIARFFDTKSVL